MTDEELSRALRGQEPPMNPEHRARLEQELLAAYDSRVGQRARRGRSPWLRYATAAGFLACLVTATQVTAEYKVEVGKRIRLVLPAGVEPPPDLGEKVSRAFVSESSHLVNVGVMVHRKPGGSASLVVDVWGDQLAKSVRAWTAAQHARAGRSHSGSDEPQGPHGNNLLGVLGHSLFRAGASPEERSRPGSASSTSSGVRRETERRSTWT